MYRMSCILFLVLVMACETEPEVDIGDVTQLACNCDIYPQPCCCTSPIVLDLAGDGLQLTRWQDGVIFAIDPKKIGGHTAWTKAGSDDAWLVLDNTGDGLITDGTEMFGGKSAQPPRPSGVDANGFLTLDLYNENGDNVVDDRDEVFTRLRAWQDKNHDGVSQLEELLTMSGAGIGALSVEYEEIRQGDPNGNLLRYSAPVYGSPGSTVGMTAWDVLLTSPLKGEREAHGLPKPIAPPTTPPFEEPPAPEGPHILTADCRFDDHISNAHKVDDLVAAKAWWTKGTCQSNAAFVNVKLWQFHDGAWRQQDQTIGTSSPGEGQALRVERRCSNNQDSDWRLTTDMELHDARVGDEMGQDIATIWDRAPVLCSMYESTMCPGD